MNDVFIFGVANSGKTTLFNGLTGKNERTGNWFGVTTEIKCGFLKSKSGEKIAVYDLPGSYLDNYTMEGKIAANVLKNEIAGGAAIVLCEAASLEKGLKLLKSVSAYTDKIALVINFYGELLRGGGKINIKLLNDFLGCEILVAEVNEKKGVSAVNGLIARLLNKCGSKNEQKNEQKNDEQILKKHIDLTKIDQEEIAKKTLVLPSGRLNRLDEFLLNKTFFSGVFFFILFFACVYLSFGEYGIGKALSRLTDDSIKFVLLNPVRAALEKVNASPFITAFVCDGAICSVCSLVSFLPPLIVLQFFIVLAEESGVLARLAFLFDEVFAFAGLSGRAIFTFLTGYGCTAAAVCCAEGLENKNALNRAVVSLPFIPCSAKIPVYLYILSVIGGKYAFVVILLFYFLGFAAAVLFAFLNKKIKKEKSCELIVEFPPYRLPKPKTTLKSLQKFTKSFIIKIGLTVFTVTMFFWLAGAITPRGAFTNDVSASILCFVGKKLSFIFAPIGITDWRFSLAAVAGLFAKESVASVLIACGGFGAKASVAKIISCLVFFTVYSPCVTALAAIKKTAGIKYALHSFFCQNVVAIALCYATYYILAIIF